MRYLIATILISLSLLNAHAQSYQNNGSMQAQDGSYMQAQDGVYAGFGAGTMDNLGANDVSYQFMLGKLWGANRYIGVKTVAEVSSDFENAILASALVGANVYPIQANISPYIGAAAGIGYANGSAPGDALGLDMAGTIGLSLFRTGPFKINIEGNANFLFREVQNGSLPMTFTGRVGLVF